MAGVVKDGTAFYGVDAGEFRYPVLMSQPSIHEMFGTEPKVSSLLLRTASGVNRDRLAQQLQGEFLANGLVATDIPGAVRDTYAANTQMFRLLQGYLALGLLVAITGLGVIMVRSVRERRRTIGVLRALGFRAKTIRRAFTLESTFIAVEGVVVGTLLGILTTWLALQQQPHVRVDRGVLPDRLARHRCDRGGGPVRLVCCDCSARSACGPDPSGGRRTRGRLEPDFQCSTWQPAAAAAGCRLSPHSDCSDAPTSSVRSTSRVE